MWAALMLFMAAAATAAVIGLIPDEDAQPLQRMRQVTLPGRVRVRTARTGRQGIVRAVWITLGGAYLVFSLWLLMALWGGGPV